MAACQLANEEHERTEAHAQQHDVRALEIAARRARAERFREAIARHVTGTVEPSNYEAMCDVIRRDPNAGPEPCEDCAGLGFRPLPETVVEQYRSGIAAKLAECERIRKQIRATPPDGSSDSSYEVRRLLERLRDTGENVMKLREELNKRTICRRCKGSTYAPRRRDSTTARPDSMFTTVGCPRCRGIDRRRHWKLMTFHHGSSAGQLRIRDQRFDAEGFPLENARNDAAAERHDACPACLGEDGIGRGYVEPISVRPLLKTSNVLDDPNGVDGFETEAFPRTDFEAPTSASELAGDEDGPDPGCFLAETRREDPVLAAALAVYHGAEADEYDAHPWGRRFVLWPLTEAGKRIAERTGHLHAAGGYEGTLELCRTERNDAEASTASPLSRALCRNAEIESRALEARVKQAIEEAVAA
jgi:RNase P subunit RPR2